MGCEVSNHDAQPCNTTSVSLFWTQNIWSENNESMRCFDTAQPDSPFMSIYFTCKLHIMVWLDEPESDKRLGNSTQRRCASKSGTAGREKRQRGLKYSNTVYKLFLIKVYTIFLCIKYYLYLTYFKIIIIFYITIILVNISVQLSLIHI